MKFIAKTVFIFLFSTVCNAAPFKVQMDNDIDCMVAAIYFEARDQPTVGQMLVAHVIKNRLHDSRYPDNICDVVKQKWAFSFYWDGKPEIVDDTPAWEKAMEVAWLAWTSHYDLTDGATLYYNPSLVKEFPWDLTKVVETVTINEHKAFREI